MTGRKHDEALALLALLSDIDDEHIAHAESYFVKKRSSKKPLYAALTAAASVFLIMTLILGVFINTLGKLFGSPGNDSPDATPKTVYSVLSSATADTTDTVDLFEPCIVWQTDKDGYSVLRVKQNEIKRLYAYTQTAPSVTDEKASDIKIWLCAGNGTVVSPYLKHSDGNIGITLFDYEPELVPTERFIEELQKVILERNN